MVFPGYIQSILRVSTCENNEKSILDIQHSILELDIIRKLRLFFQYLLNVY